MRLCLRWQNTEAGLMLEQVRLWLPGLQTSAASAHLFPWQQHLFSDTATIRGRGERDKLKGRKEGGDKDRWRQIKERKMGRESAVVAPADKAELFMKPLLSPWNQDRDCAFQTTRQPWPKQTTSETTASTLCSSVNPVPQISNTACWRNALQHETLYLSNKPQEAVVWKDPDWEEHWW